MNLPKLGDRIVLMRTDDPYTRLRRGSEGTVVRVREANDGPAIYVRWDDGSTLMLLPDEGDEWQVIS